LATRVTYQQISETAVGRGGSRAKSAMPTCKKREFSRCTASVCMWSKRKEIRRPQCDCI